MEVVVVVTVTVETVGIAHSVILTLFLGFVVAARYAALVSAKTAATITGLTFHRKAVITISTDTDSIAIETTWTMNWGRIQGFHLLRMSAVRPYAIACVVGVWM